MVEVVVTILIFIAVIAIAAVLFGGWLIVATCRMVMRMLSAPFRRAPDHTAMIEGPTLPSGATRCSNDRCRVENPAVASFCRRCGSPLRAVERVPVRRVAMW